MRLILASTSPRRREILALLGAPFEVIAPDFEELVSPHSSIEAEVLDFAVGKAQSVARAYPGSIVIGSDTMISLDGEKIGKPSDPADARRILRSLSGRRHAIYTSVAVVDGSGGPGVRWVETVDVKMRSLTARDIDWYLAQGESMDKAGAYSIQGEGRVLIAAIEGDYLAAVGLPLMPIAQYLSSRGLPLNSDIDTIYADKSFQNWRRFA
jgi:nucleoside triphosphate pyrophosphatase